MASLPMHPDFPPLRASWELSLRADAYAENTQRAYLGALTHFAEWLYNQSPDTDPTAVTRNQVRGWLAELRSTRSAGTARSWFAGVRHFFRWLVAEEESDHDPTQGIRTPPPGAPVTEVLSTGDIRRLLSTCTGTGFVARRDRAILLLFVDGGVRLAEVAGLTVDDVDIRDRIVFVAGKSTNRSGPRHRAVPLGIRAAQALDRYLRERRRHPYSATEPLWLGARGRPTMSRDGIVAMLKRRGATAGVRLHAHVFRHTWAAAFRADGGSEGDLMTLGGWRSRTMLDRYGKATAADRARESYRKHSLGDRL
jgi:site-specific recombinase XerD